MPLGSSMGSEGRRSVLAPLCAPCVHTVTLPILRKGDIGLSTSPFRRCSFTPHPPIRLRTRMYLNLKLNCPENTWESPSKTV